MKGLSKVTTGGAIFGLIAPFVGIFFGLQVSTTIGNILAWPFILLVIITDVPIGMWSGVLFIFGIALSMICWAIAFLLIQVISKQLWMKQ